MDGSVPDLGIDKGWYNFSIPALAPPERLLAQYQGKVASGGRFEAEYLRYLSDSAHPDVVGYVDTLAGMHKAGNQIEICTRNDPDDIVWAKILASAIETRKK